MLLSELLFEEVSDQDKFLITHLKAIADAYTGPGVATAVTWDYEGNTFYGIQLSWNKRRDLNRFTVDFTPAESSVKDMLDDDSDNEAIKAAKAKLAKRRNIKMYVMDSGHGAYFSHEKVDITQHREIAEMFEEEMHHYDESYGGDNDGEAYSAI